ncbi:hypothetical protein BUE93_05805 [Chromobacterium amazonense]|uniref:Uncharacterized protein n=1 Tax=Chromobacterium amazonense TaxID=1382803 RepID=A0A2S9X6Z8_9NEIS|nr:hypothetical protein [Chromobacterium amazonense]PRP71512.1 hypothetical protein BUE93_05805 [Chromobacterium amazonense]
MRLNIIEYDPQSGRIVQTGRSRPENLALEIEAGKAMLEGEADPATQYVVNQTLTPRPPNPARLDGLCLRALPAPCQIVIDDTVYDCPDTECELSFAHPGLHRVGVEAFPLQSAYFEIST